MKDIHIFVDIPKEVKITKCKLLRPQWRHHLHHSRIIWSFHCSAASLYQYEQSTPDKLDINIIRPKQTTQQEVSAPKSNNIFYRTKHSFKSPWRRLSAISDYRSHSVASKYPTPWNEKSLLPLQQSNAKPTPRKWLRWQSSLSTTVMERSQKTPFPSRKPWPWSMRWANNAIKVRRNAQHKVAKYAGHQNRQTATGYRQGTVTTNNSQYDNCHDWRHCTDLLISCTSYLLSVIKSLLSFNSLRFVIMLIESDLVQVSLIDGPKFVTFCSTLSEQRDWRIVSWRNVWSVYMMKTTWWFPGIFSEFTNWDRNNTDKHHLSSNRYCSRKHLNFADKAHTE